MQSILTKVWSGEDASAENGGFYNEMANKSHCTSFSYPFVYKVAAKMKNKETTGIFFKWLGRR